MRQNQEITDQWEQRILHAKSVIKQAEMLAELSSHPAWALWVGKFDERLNDIERELDGFEKLTAEQRALLLKEREITRRITNMAKDLDGELSRYYAELRAMETKLDERQARERTART